MEEKINIAQVLKGKPQGQSYILPSVENVNYHI